MGNNILFSPITIIQTLSKTGSVLSQPKILNFFVQENGRIKEFNSM